MENPFDAIFWGYGKVPLFYYLFHLVHNPFSNTDNGVLCKKKKGFTWESLELESSNLERPAIGSEVSLGGVYLVWIGWC